MIIISDVFEEEGIPQQNVAFYGGFGMITLYDVKKPVYRAFELLHNLGDTEVTAIWRYITVTNI